MKQAKIILFAIACLIATSCTSQTNKTTTCIFPKSNLKVDNLKGQVSLIRQQSYKAVFVNGKVEKGGKLDYTSFDDNSLLKFNRSGFMTEFLSYNDTTLQLERKEVMEFTSGGCPSKIQIYDKGSLSWGEELKYDYVNGILTTFRLDEKGKISGKRQTKYGRYGETEVVYFTKDDKIAYKTAYTYNERGEVVLTLNYDATGNLKSSDTAKYDYNINSVTTNYPDGHVGSTRVELRNRENLITELYYKSADLTYKKTYTYIFDKKGNWIKQIVFDESKPTSITERTISYY